MNKNTGLDNIPDEILDLISKEATNSLSIEDKKELFSWIDSNPHLKNQYDEFLDQMKKHHLIYHANQTDSDKAWKQINKSLKPSSKTKTLYLRIGAIAASLLVLIAIGWILNDSLLNKTETVAEIHQVERSNEAVLVLSNGEQLNLNDSEQEIPEDNKHISIVNTPGEVLSYETKGEKPEQLSYNKLIVPMGARYQLQLSDGTKVWLNSDSEIEYPIAFGDNERKVKIKGEVYFEVKTDIERPFLISINSYEVKALGTAFNISSYDEDSFFQTTLVEGKVEVTNWLGEKIMLDPGQMLNIEHKKQTLELRNVDTRFYTSWKDGILHFNKVTLSELMVKLERWYNVSIDFENEEKKGLIYSGAMENSRNIEFLLNLIEKTADVQFELNEKQIVVK